MTNKNRPKSARKKAVAVAGTSHAAKLRTPAASTNDPRATAAAAAASTKPLQAPLITEQDLRAFHAAHFPHAPAPLQFFAGQTQDRDGDCEEEWYDEEEDDGLGYYPDGVKRTLTDEQIAIFRHSEIQQLLKKRRLREEAANQRAARVIEPDLIVVSDAPQPAHDRHLKADAASPARERSTIVPPTAVTSASSAASPVSGSLAEAKIRALNALASPSITCPATTDSATTETPSFSLTDPPSATARSSALSDSSLEPELMPPGIAKHNERHRKKKKHSQMKPRHERKKDRKLLSAAQTPDAPVERARKDLGIPYEQRNKRTWEQFAADAEDDPERRTTRRQAREADEVPQEKVELDY